MYQYVYPQPITNKINKGYQGEDRHNATRMNEWIQTRIYDLTQAFLEYESMNSTVRFQQFMPKPKYDRLSPERQMSAYPAPPVDFERSLLNGKLILFSTTFSLLFSFQNIHGLF